MALRLIKAGTAVAAVSLAVFGLAGCGSDDKEPAKTDASASAPAAAAFPITVKHAMGEAQIKAQPTRVLALDRGYFDAAVALGANVVGYTTFTAKDPGVPAYFGTAGQQFAKEAKSVGTLDAPKPEQILAAKPDLIVSSKDRHEQGYSQLSQLGVPVVFGEKAGDWKANLELVGKALGKEKEAEKLLADYSDRADKIREAITAKNSGKVPTVSVVRFAGEPTVRLYTPASFIGSIIDDLGLARPDGQPTSDKDISVDLSPERIKDLDAEHIFVTSYADDTGEVEKLSKKFTGNPLWGKLKGAKHDVNDEIWMTSTGLLGAQAVLDDIAKTFGVDAFKTS